MSLKILFLSAEVAPFAKTGGLGDVGGSLPKALKALGHDVRVVMPAFRAVESAIHTRRWDLKALPGHLGVTTRDGILPAGVFEGRLPGSDVPVYFIAENNLFNREHIYGYNDDAYRFAFYGRAALDLTVALGWRPDVVHAHDWHSAPAITWLATAGQADERFRGIPSVFTIHNLAHQGRTSWDIIDYMRVMTHRLTEEGHGEINFMARGIYHSTLVSTVSPTYAREIMTSGYGAELDGLLRHRHYDLHGILNGLDYDVWDPQRDPQLAEHFSATSLEKRAGNKRALQERLGLPVNPDVPIVAMVTRLDYQKGLDITGHVAHMLLNGFAGDAQMVVLGSGAPEYENMFRHLENYHPHKIRPILAYVPDLAPLIYGGSDVFLMPSRFEPCGLGQLIAMRYGSVPVVRATGGLADTVHQGITGFTFYNHTADDFWNALQHALYIYRTDKSSWRAIQHNGMQLDTTWDRSAHGYLQLFEWARSRMRGW